jgi:shikimate 5-dehydrogenase
MAVTEAVREPQATDFNKNAEKKQKICCVSGIAMISIETLKRTV